MTWLSPVLSGARDFSSSQTADKTFILQDFRIHWLGTDRRAHGGGGICEFDDIVVIILGQVRLILAILAGSGRSAELTW